MMSSASAPSFHRDADGGEFDAILDVIPSVSGALSVLGSSCIVLAFILSRGKHTELSDRLVFAMSCQDVLGSAMYALGPLFPGGSWACKLQGFILQLNTAVPYYTLALATNMFQRIVLEKRVRAVGKHEKLYHCAVWLLPVISSFAVLFLDQYSLSGPWCWIADSQPIMRLAFFFIPLWFGILYNAFVLVAIIRKIRRVRAATGRSSTRETRKGLLYISVFFVVVLI
jgi:hypothetical protein